SEMMEDRNFDVAVIDEATQSTEPSCLIPVTHAEKVVMAGDHRRLPPTIKSQEAAKRGLENTMFERLAEEHPEKKSLLKQQYRMHRDIMDFSSTEFYGGELEAPEEVATHTLEDLDFNPTEIEEWSDVLAPEEPVVFVDTACIEAGERTPQGSTSKENPEEAEIVSSMVDELLDAGLEGEQVAVISPYDDQVDLLSRKIDYEDLEVDTVDGFQGREKEAVLLHCLGRRYLRQFHQLREGERTLPGNGVATESRPVSSPPGRSQAYRYRTRQPRARLLYR
ncbi:MAG: AAA domain-containing protein, partial [Candidatus Nanohaloarchaea archaeon]